MFLLIFSILHKMFPLRISTISCVRQLLPDPVTTKNASKPLQKKEDLQEDGPSTQELVCFHPKAAGPTKKMNINQKLLIMQKYLLALDDRISFPFNSVSQRK